MDDGRFLWIFAGRRIDVVGEDEPWEVQHEGRVPPLAGGGGVDDGMAVHAAHAGGRVVIGVDGGDFRDPGEMRQVEVEQGVL